MNPEHPTQSDIQTKPSGDTTPKDTCGGSLIDDQGNEIPITRKMVEDVLKAIEAQEESPAV